MLGIDHQNGRFSKRRAWSKSGLWWPPTAGCEFAGQRREEVYDWVEQTLVRHEYAGCRGRTKAWSGSTSRR